MILYISMLQVSHLPFFMIGILSVMFSLFISLMILNVFLFFLYIIPLFLLLGNSMVSQQYCDKVCFLGCHTYAGVVDIGHFSFGP